MTHGSWLEWVQFSTALVGCLIQVWVWVDAWHDYRLVWRVTGATRVHQVVAHGNMRGETLRLILALVFVTVGVVAVSIPPPPLVLSRPEELKLWGLLVASVVTAVTAIYSQRDRRELLHDETVALTAREELESVKDQILEKISESTAASREAEHVAQDINDKLANETNATLRHIEATTDGHTEQLADIQSRVPGGNGDTL